MKLNALPIHPAKPSGQPARLVARRLLRAMLGALAPLAILVIWQCVASNSRALAGLLPAPLQVLDHIREAGLGLQHLDVEFPLVAEVVVDRGLGDISLLGYQTGAGRLEPDGPEDPKRGLKNFAAAAGRAAFLTLGLEFGGIDRVIHEARFQLRRRSAAGASIT